MAKEGADTGRTRRRSRWRAWLAGIVGALVIAGIVGFFAAGPLLRRRFEVAINKNHERLLFETASMRTSAFGSSEVEGFRIRGQNRRCQWEVKVDHATARVRLVPFLLRRRIHFDEVRARGVTVRIRFFPQVEGDEGSEHAPPIEGFAVPPLSAAQRPEPKVRKKDPFTFRFTDAVAEDFRELWIGPYRFAGAGMASCDDVVVQPRRILDIDDAVFSSTSGELTKGDVVVARDLRLETTTTIDGYDPQRDRPRDIFRFLEARASGTAALDVIGFEDTKLKNLDWVAFRGSKGKLDLDLRVDEGRIASGSRAHLVASHLAVKALALIVEGSAVADFTVQEEGERGMGRASLLFDAFGARSSERSPKDVRVQGSGLEMKLATPSLELLDPLTEYEIDVTMPDTRLRDVGVLDDLIPRQTGVRLRSGSASMAGTLHATKEGATGAVRVKGEDVALDFAGKQEQRLVVDLDLDGKLRLADFTGRRYDFGGSALRFSPASRSPGRGWGATVSVPRAVIDADAAVRFDADVQAHLQDLRPIIAVADSMLSIPDIFLPLLRATDVDMRSTLRFGPELVQVRDFELDGKGLEARACVNIGPPAKSYVIWVDSGFLQGGVRLSQGERHVKLGAGKAWYPLFVADCAGRR